MSADHGRNTLVLKTSEINGFSANQRVVAQDVQANPPQLYSGTIVSVWNNGTAHVAWDRALPFAAERRLVDSGYVDLHYLNRVS